ncbi:hypothetical protein [Glutamicibacter sp. NPDC087344]|uniref:hypothetical protein n=1 Tax=Glutamicibacter sp. NPDC087344 TaxID=3363994 RepID=UPI0038047598
MSNNEILRPVYRVLVLVFSTAHIIMGISSFPELVSIWPCLIAILICVAVSAYVVFTQPLDLDLPLRKGVLIVTLTTTMSFFVNLGLPDGFPGYGWWNSGATEMILVALVLRGLQPIAWLGLGSLCLVQGSFGALHHVSWIEIFTNLITPALWVSFAVVTRWQIERNRRKIQKFEDESDIVYRRQLAEHAHHLTTEEWETVLQGEASALLREIDASNGRLTDEQLIRFQVYEQEFRDKIMSEVFTSKTLLQLVHAARLNGLKVKLNDMRKVSLSAETASHLERTLEDLFDHYYKYQLVNITAHAPSEPFAVTVLVRDSLTGEPNLIEVS